MQDTTDQNAVNEWFKWEYRNRVIVYPVLVFLFLVPPLCSCNLIIRSFSLCKSIWFIHSVQNNIFTGSISIDKHHQIKSVMCHWFHRLNLETQVMMQSLKQILKLLGIIKDTFFYGEREKKEFDWSYLFTWELMFKTASSKVSDHLLLFSMWLICLKHTFLESTNSCSN